MSVPTACFDQQRTFRIVSSRFPPVGVFDAIATPDDLDALFELEGMTNDRLREAIGDLNAVPRERRVSGPGMTPVMAAFTHPNTAGSRFSDGRTGVFYAALAIDTAIRETVHHRQRFLRATCERACRLDMRCYVHRIGGTLDDIRGGYPELHAADSYAASQTWAAERRRNGADGVVYDSVRDSGGTCFGLYYPDLVRSCTQHTHFHYEWDGQRISRVYEVSGLQVL